MSALQNSSVMSADCFLGGRSTHSSRLSSLMIGSKRRAQYANASMSGSLGNWVKCAHSSLVNQAMFTIAKLARTSSMWKANSKACHGALNLYGLISPPGYVSCQYTGTEASVWTHYEILTNTNGYIT